MASGIRPDLRALSPSRLRDGEETGIQKTKTLKGGIRTGRAKEEQTHFFYILEKYPLQFLELYPAKTALPTPNVEPFHSTYCQGQWFTPNKAAIPFSTDFSRRDIDRRRIGL
jgi:hypothetical protein